MNSVQIYESLFSAFTQAHNGAVKATLPLRESALQSFAAVGFPANRHEAWRYSNISALLKEGFTPVTEKNTPEEKLHFDNIFRIKANCLVFIDGYFSKEYSSIKEDAAGVEITSLAEHLKNNSLADIGRLAEPDDGFTALNASFFTDGAYIFLPAGKKLQYPVLLYFVSTDKQSGKVSMPRNLIVAGAGSQCSVIECYQNLTAAPAASNAVTEVIVEESASVDYYKMHSRADNYTHIGSTAIALEKNSRLRSWAITLGGRFIRNNLRVMLTGVQAEAHLYGLYVLAGKDYGDNHVVVEHKNPHCYSNQLYKGVLGGAAHGVFSGKILVHPGAQKTNAYQSNKNILLSQDATVNSKPQLEIFADDVKCSHGSTTGQLDEDAVFYMQTRGISKAQALNILHQAFACEIIDKTDLQELKDYLYYALLIALNR
ncbi:MAG: Fe-S cluster assembly protein SufD [Chitinophagales bacterium]|nr:MAG: Fe-S cluster assembly protein SufD [Chitinophagales bacterium]